MDALSTVLEATRLRSVVYNKFPFAAPWGLDVVKDENSQFWRLVSGSCTVGSPDGRIIELAEGDLVFVPHGSAHWIADKSTSLRMPSPEFVKARRAGIEVFKGNGDVTILIAGHFEFAYQPLHPFLKDLPPIIHIKQYVTENQLLLKQVAELMLEELNNERPGSGVMLKCLSEIMFVSIIRAYLEQAVPDHGFLSALNDARISKALKLIQDSPQNDWTLESLSSEIGMSRSVFFNQFKKLLRETPLSYLTNWRIGQAQKLLLTDNSNISEIAANVGYQSEAAFNRIFKSKTGQTPAVYRRTHLLS
ncbi:AraC family transcriptional regulator [Mucilaginibacter gotjawali]|uniref:AraC-like DNA-binding protein n=2 Tax=Mucilaginibacter gotjawali TaxID=1550579 RepID=A0A839SK44_9SPHI|nr:AraC family transcriptional regulator [Mucilaginibacter gotjawali]MBB3058711.1 AraC-like DNA-binding protein [Mucilaginibacter gotjawali]BAU55685.1 HTH-type transcriptional activator Btr [Mucilaginibacter gotjawali]